MSLLEMKDNRKSWRRDVIDQIAEGLDMLDRIGYHDDEEDIRLLKKEIKELELLDEPDPEEKFFPKKRRGSRESLYRRRVERI